MDPFNTFLRTRPKKERKNIFLKSLTQNGIERWATEVVLFQLYQLNMTGNKYISISKEENQTQCNLTCLTKATPAHEPRLGDVFQFLIAKINKCTEKHICPLSLAANTLV